MSPALTTASALLALLSLAQFTTAQTHSYVGCYSSSTGLTSKGSYGYQSSGYCGQECIGDGNSAVMGLTGGDTCYCGNSLPPSSAKVSDSNCNTICVGYGPEKCGGSKYWTVYLTGTKSNVPTSGGSSSNSNSDDDDDGNADDSASTSAATSAAKTTASAPTTTSPSTTETPDIITSIAPGTTVIVTASVPNSAARVTSETSPTPSKASEKDDSGPNVTGIAVGVVVGVVVIAALIGGFFFWRRRKQRKADEEYRSHQSSDFLAGGKATIPSMRRHQGPDSRVDADAMAQRRMSDGSIADNEDYSRRILKVTNPSDH